MTAFSNRRTTAGVIAVAIVLSASLLVQADPGVSVRTVYDGETRWRIEKRNDKDGRASLRGRMKRRSGETELDTARRAMKSTSQFLSMDKSTVDDLSLVRTKRSRAGVHLMFQPKVGGIPVDRGSVTVHLGGACANCAVSSRIRW